MKGRNFREIRASFEDAIEGFHLGAATGFYDGAIIIDEFDDDIFDDVLRSTVAWSRISKSEAPGDTTGGFDQTAIGDASSADPRTLTFVKKSASREARERKAIRAIIMGREFGIFNRSVGILQGRPFSDLTAKDVRDMYFACMRKWNSLFYEGNYSSDDTQFTGLRTLLNSSTTTIGAGESIVRKLDDVILSMIDTKERDVMPTAIYCTGKTVQMISSEFQKIGEKMDRIDILVKGNVFRVPVLYTSAGPLPVFADKFNRPVAGTPNTHVAFVVSEDKLDWQYVPILGVPGAEPKTFEFAMQNDFDVQFASLMFGALELLGGTNHHRRVNIVERSLPIDMTVA